MCSFIFNSRGWGDICRHIGILHCTTAPLLPYVRVYSIGPLSENHVPLTRPMIVH